MGGAGARDGNGKGNRKRDTGGFDEVYDLNFCVVFAFSVAFLGGGLAAVNGRSPAITSTYLRVPFFRAGIETFSIIHPQHKIIYREDGPLALPFPSTNSSPFR